MAMILFPKPLVIKMHIYILQIDTATEICSVSISLNGKTIGKIEATEPNVHASNLTIYIAELLKDLKLDYNALSAVCVSKGPGSYTGLRIGVSTAKGLCYALGIPLLAINTLEMMYCGYSINKTENTLYIPMLDARRMEVYLEIFDSKGNLILPTEARIIDTNSFDTFSDHNIVLFGSGATKLKQMFEEQNNITIDSTFIHSSSSMSNLAYEKYNSKNFEDLIYFEPFYLKEFIAILPKKLI